MILSSRYGLKIADLYFDETSTTTADLIRFHYWSEPVAGSVVLPYLTATIDLRKEPADLLAAMAKSTRWNISRAERDAPFSAEFYTGRNLPLAEFIRFFDAFADAKGTHRAYQSNLAMLSDHGMLMLTRISDAAGTELVWHAYMTASGYARQLYSGTLQIDDAERSWYQTIGRANKYLHWRDILRLRENRTEFLDLGGVCEDSCEDPALKGIREFKTSFGGTVKRLYDCTKPVSVLARTAMWLKGRTR